MIDEQLTGSSLGRRHFLVRAIVAIQSTMAATIAFILGAAALARDPLSGEYVLGA